MTVTRGHHELKTWPAYFAAIRSGAKKFEIRRNDREFAVGDTLLLKEFDPDGVGYTGETETRMITFLLSEEAFGVAHDFVGIGFDPLPNAAPVAASDLSLRQLADWHASASSNAALRAEGARKLSDSYRQPASGRQSMPVAADRYAAVAELGHHEASFHAAAVRLIQEHA